MAHVVFVLLCLFPELAAPALLLGVAAFGFAGRREAPSFATDPWISTGGQFAEAVAALKAGALGAAPEQDHAPSYALTEQQRGEEQASTSLLDEALENTQAGAGQLQPQGGAQGEPGRSLLQPEEQQALLSILGRYAKVAETLAERYALRVEQIVGIFTWRDPLVSRGVFTMLALLALALFIIPLRSVVLCAGLWVMRHPVLRSPSEGAWLQAALSRLTGGAEGIE